MVKISCTSKTISGKKCTYYFRFFISVVSPFPITSSIILCRNSCAIVLLRWCYLCSIFKKIIASFLSLTTCCSTNIATQNIHITAVGPCVTLGCSTNIATRNIHITAVGPCVTLGCCCSCPDLHTKDLRKL